MLQTGFVAMTRPFLFGRLHKFHNEFSLYPYYFHSLRKQYNAHENIVCLRAGADF